LCFLDRLRPWTRSWTPCLDRKGPLFLMLWSTNLYDRPSVFFTMCSVRFIWDLPSALRLTKLLLSCLLFEKLTHIVWCMTWSKLCCQLWLSQNCDFISCKSDSFITFLHYITQFLLKAAVCSFFWVKYYPKCIF